MALVYYLLTISIEQVELQSAKLCTLASVCTTIETMLRCIANSRITDTQGSMHKHLKFYIRYSLVYILNLL